MSQEIYVLGDISRKWFYYGRDSRGQVLLTTILERARQFRGLALAEKMADTLDGLPVRHLEPVLLSAAKEANGWNE